jgi:hypothetical protein
MTVDGSASPPPAAIPSVTALDLRVAAGRPADPSETAKHVETPGSNAFAVAGSRTRDGRAIVGNDMHLALMAPNFWYRVDLAWDGGRLIGLSLPGVPAIVQGTNGHVSWGFTNLTADLADVIVVERDPTTADHYLTADGPKPFAKRSVTVGSGAGATQIEALSTEFGPVVGTERPVRDGGRHHARGGARVRPALEGPAAERPGGLRGRPHWLDDLWRATAADACDSQHDQLARRGTVARHDPDGREADDHRSAIGHPDQRQPTPDQSDRRTSRRAWKRRGARRSSVSAS